MPIKHFPPPPGVKAPPLSFAARTGDLLYISGIPGFDENRGLPDTFEAKFRNVVTNIKRVLDEASGTFRDLGPNYRDCSPRRSVPYARNVWIGSFNSANAVVTKSR